MTWAVNSRACRTGPADLVVELDLIDVEPMTNGGSLTERAGRARTCCTSTRRGELVALGEDDVAAPPEEVADGHADDDAAEARWKSRLPVSRRYPDSALTLVASWLWTRNRLPRRASAAAVRASSEVSVV